MKGCGWPKWRPWRRRAPVADQGLATVWAAVTTTTLCTVFAVILALGQVVAARHRAGGAADLAALAAADRALEGAAAACESAEKVAGAQGANVVRCAVQGEVADVTARVRFGPYAPEVRSRAGPAAEAPPPATGRRSPDRPEPPEPPERTGGVP
ncbi:Rv3654c family TadE-like protein [Streptomyces sp. NBC_01420]|uniref:Rv3654c family TadE-like protein n=1 Tax=Streptomyces sp. NBC_01420 TaxID=2903858 RepID=UPI00386B572E